MSSAGSDWTKNFRALGSSILDKDEALQACWFRAL